MSIWIGIRLKPCQFINKIIRLKLRPNWVSYKRYEILCKKIIWMLSPILKIKNKIIIVSIRKKDRKWKHGIVKKKIIKTIVGLPFTYYIFFLLIYLLFHVVVFFFFWNDRCPINSMHILHVIYVFSIVISVENLRWYLAVLI